MESDYKLQKVNHLAGIVPIAGQPIGYGLPYHDSLIPVGHNIIAIENAIYECAMAGCESIWLVCYSGIEPLIRKRIGDYIIDPVSIDTRYPMMKRRDISIFYVPVNPKDRSRRDSLGWSVLYGADTAFRLAVFLSKWVLPDRFYCAFPYGITSADFIRENRKIISSSKKVIFTHDNKSVKDGLHMSFTFNAQDYKNCRDIIKKRIYDEWDYEKDKHAAAKNNSKFYTIQQVFTGLDFSDALMVDLPWFHDISTWDGYRQYMGSEHSSTVIKYEHIFTRLKRRKFPKWSETEYPKIKEGITND